MGIKTRKEYVKAPGRGGGRYHRRWWVEGLHDAGGSNQKLWPGRLPRQVLEEKIARSMALENDRQFLHGKQKRAPTNFARRSITTTTTTKEPQPFFRAAPSFF